MTSSDYLAMAIYREREREMIRNNERRRAQAERLENEAPGAGVDRGIVGALSLRFNRLHAVVRHQTARG